MRSCLRLSAAIALLSILGCPGPTPVEDRISEGPLSGLDACQRAIEPYDVSGRTYEGLSCLDDWIEDASEPLLSSGLRLRAETLLDHQPHFAALGCVREALGRVSDRGRHRDDRHHARPNSRRKARTHRSSNSTCSRHVNAPSNRIGTNDRLDEPWMDVNYRNSAYAIGARMFDSNSAR